MDNFTRENLKIDVNDHIGGHRVVEVLMQVGKERKLPRTIRKVESWRQQYNNERPHGALGNMAPTDYALATRKIHTCKTNIMAGTKTG